MRNPAQENLLDAGKTSSGEAIHSAYAFEAIVAQYETPLLRYVGSLIGVEHATDAEDLVQEAFLRLHRQVVEHGESSVRNISSWLFRVAHNLALNARRRSGREKRKYERAARSTSAAVSNGNDGADAVGDMMQREAAESALAELNRLPAEQREVILLRILQGMTLREIGEVTGLTPGNVGYRVSQGLQELSRRLKASGVI